MNETTGTETGKKGLSGSFKKGSVASIPYGHPHAGVLLEQARGKIIESEIGQVLIRVWDNFNIPVHVIKGDGESGFSPETNTIYLQISGAAKTPTPEFVLALVKALREADLEYSGYKTPDPALDITAYAAFVHARNLETITCICKFVKELSNSSYFSVLLDTLPKLGLNTVYEAYVDGASKEQLYDKYAEAYDNERGKWL